jgi:putative SOS response-associated peptidase YedK
MIHHYQGARQRKPYALRFGIEFQPGPQSEVRPGQSGVFVRRPRADQLSSRTSVNRFEAVTGRWGLIPLFSKDGLDPLFVAPAESAASERNFLQPWKRGHRCVVLADAVIEDGVDGGLLRHVRADGQPLAIAGLWNGWRSPKGECVESFAVLSVRADGSRRQLALLHDAWLDDWLTCPVEETAAFLRPSSATAELVTREA